MGKRKRKPSKTRRHRESVAAKRKARAFYRLRNGGADVAASSSCWRRRVALLAAKTAMAAIAGSVVAVSLGILLWAIAETFS